MKKPNFKLLNTTLLPLFLLIIVFTTKAQENKKESLEIFDEIISLENTKLYNGKRYYNLYKSTSDNHNFFIHPNYQKGNVFYDGQYFINVDLKYDVFNHKLIYKPTGEKGFLNIELIENKIDSFNFGNHKFINSSIIKENKGLVSGHLERLYTSPTMTLYSKRKKTVTERIKQRQLTYIFYKADSYYLSYNTVLYDIDSSRDLRKIFPNLNKDIKKENKEIKRRFKDDEEGLYRYLINFINFNLITNNAN